MEKEDNYSLWQFVRDLARYVKPYRNKFWIGVFLRLTSDLARLVPVWAISALVTLMSVSGKLDSHAIMMTFWLWVISAAYFSWSHNLAKYFGYQVAEKASLDLYQDAVTHLFRLDLAWQETENSGTKLKKIDKGLDGVNITIRRLFDVFIEVAVNTVGTILIINGQDWRISVSLLFFTVGYFILGTYLLKRAVSQERVVNKGFEELGGIAFEAVNNIQTIKALGIDSGIKSTIESNLNGLFPKIRERVARFQAQGAALFVFEMMYLLSAVYWIINGILHGRYEVGLLVLFMGLYRRFETSVEEMTDSVQQVALAKIWVSRTMTIMRVVPTIENPARMATQQLYPNEWRKLTISHLGFAYKKSHILKDISLTIERGEKIGIVGLSGAGKSTLFKLLLDLYEDYEGDITLDNVSLKAIRRQSFIDHVSVVLQDTELFDLSLRQNIEIARTSEEHAHKSLLEKVIHDSHMDAVVRDLPQGLETIIGEKGFKLSGGQRQRLGIARALYRQPDILLLDEATSHLDAHSEKEIQRALEENIGKFTTIVIAHRLSTIKAMDKIVVLEHGQIVETGSFQDLLKRGKQFAAMWKEQKI
jgi:ATP-binding cassette subfamily B protein